MNEERDALLAEIPLSIKFALWGLGRWLRGLSKEKRMKLLVAALKYIVTLKALDGYRMYLSGFGFIGLGAYLLFEVGDVEKGVAAISGGLAIIGKAGKDDKAIAAQNANTVVTAAASPGVPQIPPSAALEAIRELPGPIPGVIEIARNLPPSVPGPSEH